ncbi:MAG: hypothetical protein BroJett040_12180 [Oligoflexia bacterium]|jgi:hypothetical protein|nr:MAG: hypothetical protein BroJett040_12180 [Oligoflexia bacterium]
MLENKSKNLKISSLPKSLAELTHSNQFLKVFALSALALLFMGLGVTLVMAMKGPMVITLGPDGKALERAILPKAEDQIREGIRRYLEKRYQWGPENVIKKLKESEQFITPQALKAFQVAVANVAKFSTEKIVSQKVYPEKIEIDLKKQTALITGDRITSIQGLKAAGNLKLELTFESGLRTHENPWGIYISKEREE